MFGPNSILIALGGVLAAVLAAFLKGRIEGARAERARRAEAEIRARDIADEVQNDVGAMLPDAARKELSRWARK
jgi:hypothetical protein